MEIFPAIDIRSGRVVRLSQGDATRETAYESDPVAQAERFVDEGARWLHVVDLDRAFERGDNASVIDRILARVGDRVRIQLGGGVRTAARVRGALESGVTRVVLGSAAVSAPDVVAGALQMAGPDHIAVGVDARDGLVAVRGWQEGSGHRVEEVVRRVVKLGVTTVVYTDITRDGMLAGADTGGAVALQGEGAAVILSGGIASLSDLRAAAAAGLAGAIVGRALYERRFSLREALAIAPTA